MAIHLCHNNCSNGYALLESLSLIESRLPYTAVHYEYHKVRILQSRARLGHQPYLHANCMLLLTPHNYAPNAVHVPFTVNANFFTMSGPSAQSSTANKSHD
jgi:hypothetical protein